MRPTIPSTSALITESEVLKYLDDILASLFVVINELHDTIGGEAREIVEESTILVVD